MKLLVEEHVSLSILNGKRVDRSTVAIVVLVPLLVEIVATERRVVTAVGTAVVANHRAQVVLGYFVFTVFVHEWLHVEIVDWK